MILAAEVHIQTSRTESEAESTERTPESTGDTDAGPDDAQLELALEEIRAALDAQWDQWKHRESRLQFFLGWIATGASVSVALGVGKSVPNGATRVFLIGAGLLAIFTLAVLVLAYAPLSFERPPEPVGFAERYVLAPTIDTKLMLIDTIAEAYTSNQAALDRRTTLLRYAIEGAAGAGFLAILGLAATSLPPGWGG